MEFTPLFVLVGIVVTSGFIAYVCDIVGKKLGKKRLSVFGMRPRHTATTGTVLVGALISITSICLMVVGSKDAREWIIRGGTAMRDLKVKQQEVKEKDQQLAYSDARLNSDNKLLNRDQTDLADKQKELDGLKSKINLGRQRIIEQADQQAKLQARVADFLKKLSTANLQLADKTKSLGFVTAEYSQVNASLKKVTDRFNSNLRESAKNDVAYRKTLADQKDNIAKLQETRTELEKRRDALQAQKTGLQSEVDGLSLQVKSMQGQLNAMQGDLDHDQGIFYSVVEPSRYEPMIYKYQQEVARIDLPANLTEEQATEAVNMVLDRARIEASQHGAEARRDLKSHRDYKVADVLDLTDGPSREERLSQAVARLINNPEPVVLMACASVNTFGKEPVPLDLVRCPNPLVYTKGQVIAESKIDGSESRDEVFKQLTHFFSVNLTEKTRKDNMIPDPEDQNGYGTVTYGQLYGLADTVKLKGRQVRLVAKAQTDTHAADPLKLDLEVQ